MEVIQEGIKTLLPIFLFIIKTLVGKVLARGGFSEEEKLFVDILQRMVELFEKA